MEDKTPKCSSSEHSKIDASIFCQTCKIFLCNKCQNNFHSKIFSNHQINNLSHEKKDDIFTSICYEKNHLNQLEYFCRNHNKLCCAKCITKIKDKNNGQHKDCNIISLNEIKIEKEKIFKENCNKLQKISNNLESNINKFKVLKERINKNKEELIINIQKAFTKIRTYLNEREDKLINEVEETYKNLFFDEKNSKEIEKLSIKVKQILESTKNIKDENNELSNEINNYIKFEKNFENIEEMNKIMNNSIEKKVKITFNYNINELENIIKKFGEIKEEKYDEKEDKEKKYGDKEEEIYKELEETYKISNYKDKEFIIMIIRQLNFDRDLILQWIDNNLINEDVNDELERLEEEFAKEDINDMPVNNKENVDSMQGGKNNEDDYLNDFLFGNNH